jgi:coenzyme Q-binding protein COQ10
MAEVSKEVVIACAPDRLFDVLVDYARYPEFVPGIKSCRVVPGKGERQVEYELDLGLKCCGTSRSAPPGWPGRW